MQSKADVMVVSATPNRGRLVREWDEHGATPSRLTDRGQEMGSKQGHLALAAVGRYEPEKILMVDDARVTGRRLRPAVALFYPIDPGSEDNSWQRFFEEALHGSSPGPTRANT